MPQTNIAASAKSRMFMEALDLWGAQGNSGRLDGGDVGRLSGSRSSNCFSLGKAVRREHRDAFVTFWVAGKFEGGSSDVVIG